MKNLDNIQQKLNIEMGIGSSQTQLAQEVILYVKNEGMTYLDALMQVCEDHEVDPEDLARMVRGNLRDRLFTESVTLHRIKDVATPDTLY